MKHIKLGDLDVSRIGLGAMGMPSLSNSLETQELTKPL